MTTVLAADTSTSVNTVAVCRDGVLLSETIVQCQRLHSERLVQTVDFVLREAGLTIDEVDMLAIAQGPGSFTGLRIGVATFKGLAFGAAKPLLGVPTLDAMTRLSVFQDAIVCPLLDARMREVYGAVYRFKAGERSTLTPASVGPVEDFLRYLDALEAPVVFVGDGAALYRERILQARPGAVFAPNHCSVPRAAAVAVEALELLGTGASTDAGRVEPVYLRLSQAEMTRLAARQEAAAK